MKSTDTFILIVAKGRGLCVAKKSLVDGLNNGTVRASHRRYLSRVDAMVEANDAVCFKVGHVAYNLN
jgi:hypothetical protein